MKPYVFVIAIAAAGVFSSCASSPPRELVDARQFNRRAASGPAADIAPAELHIANQALAEAELSFENDPNSFQTLDLAYVAQRKAQLAEAAAAIAIEQRNQEMAGTDYETAQGEIVDETKRDLDASRAALVASEQSEAMTATELAAERKARADAEERAKIAQAELAKLAAVREDARGTIITISGSVLFASNETALLPAAQTRLDQVADVLLASRERNVTVEGYTDSRGTDAFNLDLSQRRADAVRDYLVKHDYEPDRIVAHGLGEGSPVGDNATAEGRANNRRVEIIIEHQKQASNR